MENRHFSFAQEKVYAKLHKCFCVELASELLTLVSVDGSETLKWMARALYQTWSALFFRRLVVLMVRVMRIETKLTGVGCFARWDQAVETASPFLIGVIGR